MITTRTLLGLVLVALGGLFLLDQAGRLDAGNVIGNWWPLIIIALGTGQLIEQRRAGLGPLIVIGVGVLLLLGELELLPDNIWRYIWPVVLIVVGLALVLRRGGRGLPAGRPDEVVSASAFFSGNDVVSTSQSFRGASLTAAFGGVSLDLRQATLAPDGATVSILAAFGGAEVLVPRGWRVQASGLPLFGGFDNKANAPAAPDSPLLRVEYTVLFGGAEVKYEK